MKKTNIALEFYDRVINQFTMAHGNYVKADKKKDREAAKKLVEIMGDTLRGMTDIERLGKIRCFFDRYVKSISPNVLHNLTLTSVVDNYGIFEKQLEEKEKFKKELDKFRLEEFDKFWKMYGVKENEQSARRIWMSLARDEITEIMHYTEKYINIFKIAETRQTQDSDGNIKRKLDPR